VSLNFKEKQGLVLGLVLQCPFKAPLPTCPAIELRKLPLDEKVSSVRGMTEPSLDGIIEHHKICGNSR
jgi:hypothetical protein